MPRVFQTGIKIEENCGEGCDWAAELSERLAQVSPWSVDVKQENATILILWIRNRNVLTMRP